jgi:hypothetical protein
VFLERKGRRVAVIIPADEFEAFRQWRESLSRQQIPVNLLEEERETFKRLLPELLKTHPGQFVAIQGGHPIDADTDEGALARRTLTKADQAVTIQEVSAQPRIYELPYPEVVWHVPR